ncbi:Phosphatidylinositol-glycan biosynthesis class S protein domain-containing protein [Rozella allomycis CSF55]|uniref:Phosphatidylinositol-glycan biosynthesis class S protein domain-containing protein n=1 Tax=Rozella allomycis (strain CSF55) TaxID=988480 RepID=A0A075AMU5_ROZAC|nr:Phosphatidylinositol-glycan biosynthesis class S protein domain-containing protein [Rozella allomycis CSF55]|eukprot:EPZ31016.1 Phosphatidylinositol-glycan biosynthesis class S protein domain-containing protein [Rozella allomycis CSF55]
MEKFSKELRPGRYLIKLDCETNEGSGDKFVESNSRVFLYRTSSKCDAGFLKSIEQRLESIVTATNTIGNKAINIKKSYRLVFTLQIEDMKSSPAIDWEISLAIEKYLRPFINQLSELVDFKIESHILFDTKLAVEPKSNGTHYMLPQNDLSRVLNSASWNLESTTSSEQNIYLILFVPKRSNIIVLDEEEKEFRSFIYPQWGGIVFQSFEQSTISEMQLRPIMKLFSKQILSLFGFNFELGHVIDSNDQLLSALQVDLFMQESIIKSVIGTLETFGAFKRMLNKISNIIVPDQVGFVIQSSIFRLKRALAHMQSNKWESSYKDSRRAYLESRMALSDPSMVAMMYYPDDHKMAIYLPLFLPIITPLMITNALFVSRVY